MYTYSFMFMFFMGLISYGMKPTHFLLMLMSLESAVLSLYSMLFIYLLSFNVEFFLCMIFLTMTVCEGALGLSLLVSMVRAHNTGNLMSLDSLW
uniref:NADH-ubiquinone oxidoreductase chain 4L n=1 Tax=Scolytus schevyrewi TaxID=1158787 RepID=A0A6G6C8T7_9CUCU|nr:NADH dehydrogenase subunit 4L [Scolytus schevyrewi]QID77583.1 NADH dehydrogenase subunit 4L [Scolytus schevyrewi]